MTSKELKIMLDDNYDKAMNYNLVPKDWKPYCYVETKNGICVPHTYGVEYGEAMFPACQKCPYREARK